MEMSDGLDNRQCYQPTNLRKFAQDFMCRERQCVLLLVVSVISYITKRSSCLSWVLKHSRRCTSAATTVVPCSLPHSPVSIADALSTPPPAASPLRFCSLVPVGWHLAALRQLYHLSLWLERSTSEGSRHCSPRPSRSLPAAEPPPGGRFPLPGSGTATLRCRLSLHFH